MDTLDKLTKEMRRLRNLAHKTDTAIANGKSRFHMARIIVDIDVATAAARRAYVLFRYQLDMRKSEPDHSDETNQFLTELERDTKPDNSNGFHGYLQMMELKGRRL